MNTEQFEKMLIQFSAPTLMGVKAASLMSVDRATMPELFQNIAVLNRKLGDLGLRFAILCECNFRTLLYVYRPEMLSNKLAQKEYQEWLAQFGYPVGEELGKMLIFLRSRIASCNSFPHEIGLFLDYPLDDVAAFIEKEGADCKLCGYWKVYFNVDHAQACFARYDACREELLNRYVPGCSLSNLLCAG